LYLCQHKKYGIDPNKYTVEHAKRFIEKKAKFKLRTISKDWEDYKQAAPYIFAFFETFSDAIEQAESLDAFVDLLGKIASNQKLLSQLVGKAAYMGDILNETKIRNVRVKDFYKRSAR
jgi:hypothetical protein